MPFQPVIWTDLVNSSAAPNPNDLTKSSGVNNVEDCDAVSLQQITGFVDGYGIRFSTMPPIAGANSFGLSDINPDRLSNSIRYCFMQFSGDIPALYILEYGVQVWDTTGNNYAGEILSITLNSSGQIEYRAGALLLYTSSLAPVYPLFFDCSLQNIGLRIVGAEINCEYVAPPVVKIDHMMTCKIH